MDNWKELLLVFLMVVFLADIDKEISDLNQSIKECNSVLKIMNITMESEKNDE